jgi:two-component system LytT family response regulator
MKYKAILIDDERKSVEILRNKLERFCPDIEIIATSNSPKEGLEFVLSLNPDIVFLDIAMPELNGFDLLEKVPDPSFELIFVTAFGDFAIDAIKHCAIGYLVKPVENSDLVLAVNNAKKNINDKSSLRKNQQLIKNNTQEAFQKKKILVPSLGGFDFVSIEEIIRCEGIDGYTKVFIADGSNLVSSNSIGYFQKILEGTQFHLIHRSHLINLNAIKKYSTDGYVLLGNKVKIPVSRNRRKVFLDKLAEL